MPLLVSVHGFRLAVLEREKVEERTRRDDAAYGPEGKSEGERAPWMWAWMEA
jgi:hypothetical protein